MATGLVHPLILVPAEFEKRMSVEEQRFALWHEQLHHRRGDIWASAGALLLAAYALVVVAAGAMLVARRDVT